MFNRNFYPTPEAVLDVMLQGEQVAGKICLEPSAGKGDIVDRLFIEGARDVLAAEINPDLRKIVATKCSVIAEDFLQMKSEQISHINMIVMNPPFDKADEHILHAFEIAPAGCRIIALCNYATIKNPYSERRKKLAQIVEENGSEENIGSMFEEAERETGVEIGLLKMVKPGESYEAEFAGFFTDEDEEEQHPGAAGIMSYNVIRDIVNRYIQAIKLFDQQLELAVKMNDMTDSFFSSKLAFTCESDKKKYQRNEFKKDLQKSAWTFIFNKMNMEKHTTKGLREDINKFVEQNQQFPFTMKNIYAMLDTVRGTTGQRMNKALIEVFDKVTQSYDENRYNVEGWKTNSHYLINEKFILGGIVAPGWHGEVSTSMYSGGRAETIEDFLKALCYITGDNYDTFVTLENTIKYRYKLKILSSYKKNLNKWNLCFREEAEAIRMKESLQEEGTQSEVIDQPIQWGQWFEWAYFDIRCYKKGSVHFKFRSRELWARFNAKVAEIKGFPLPEAVKNTAKQKPARTENKSAEAVNFSGAVLGTFVIN